MANPIKHKKKKGFAALIGLIFSLVIVSILLAVSFSSFSSRQKTDNSTVLTIINRTEDKLKQINQQQLMLQKQLEEAVNNSGGK